MTKESRFPFVNGQRGSLLDYLTLGAVIAIFSVFLYQTAFAYYHEHSVSRWSRYLERHVFPSPARGTHASQAQPISAVRFHAR